MSSKAIKKLGVFQKLTKFDKGIGACLPEAYKKFYKEWRLTEPTAVNYIPEQGKYRRDDVTGEVFPVQNIPLPLKFPHEYNEQMWGGDAVVQGFEKRDLFARRVPRFWVPTLKRTVVYSEILDKYISVIITNRTLNLIHSNYGFDHYILKTPACDLKSLLPLSLKRKILQELSNGCPTHSSDSKRQEILERYHQYLSAYTPEEIEWYGYSFNQACMKLKESMDAAKKPIPLKNIYRAQLIEKLKAAKVDGDPSEVELTESTTSWIQRINPFGKKHET